MTEYIIKYIIESDWLRYYHFFNVIGSQSDPISGYHLNQRTAISILIRHSWDTGEIGL